LQEPTDIGIIYPIFSKFIEKAKSLAKKCGKIFIPYAKMRGFGDKLVTLIYRRMLTFSVSVTNPFFMCDMRQDAVAMLFDMTS